MIRANHIVPVAALSALMAALCFVETANPEDRARLSSPGEAWISREETQRTFQALLIRHRSALYRPLGSCGNGPDPGIGWDAQRGLVQARLMALGNPGDTEMIALNIEQDPDAHSDDEVFAAHVLGFLSDQGRTTASAALERLALGGPPRVVPIALEALFRSDKEGRHRHLYRDACRRRVLDAYDAGPYWADETTKRTLQEIRKRTLSKYPADYYTEESLQRIAILESPQRSAELEHLIGGLGPPDGIWTLGWSEWRQRWALKALRKYPSARAVLLLRERLHRAEQEQAEFFTKLGHEPPSPTHLGFGLLWDRHYDDVLLTFSALGGTLNDVERERLFYYGFLELKDPGPRLRRLLLVAP
jgi:hypothetical protein